MYRQPAAYTTLTSPSFHAREGVRQGSFISPTLFNFFTSTFPQFDQLLANSYADNFNVSCSNSNVAQMAEALTAHASNIEDRADERGLAISAVKPPHYTFRYSIRAI